MEKSQTTDDKLKQLDERIKYLEMVAEKSGMTKKAKLALAFEGLKDLGLQEFAQEFTITMNSYFCAYRSLSTGLVQAASDPSGLETLKNWLFKILGYVPVIGDYVGIIDDIISTIVDKWKEKDLKTRTENVMLIVKGLMVWDEDELTNAVGWAAVHISTWFSTLLIGVDPKKLAALIIGRLIAFGGPYKGFRDNFEMPSKTYPGFSLTCIQNVQTLRKLNLITFNLK